MPDAITARATGTFVPIPEGDYPAVCVDVIDLGYHLNEKYAQIQPKCALVFQLEDETGKRLELAERFTVSMGSKARLRTFLESWRGRPYKPEQVEEGVPLDKLVGNGATIAVVHNTVGDKTYANIFRISPLPKSDTPLKAMNYARAPYWQTVIDRAVPQNQELDSPETMDQEVDDLPF